MLARAWAQTISIWSKPHGQDWMGHRLDHVILKRPKPPERNFFWIHQEFFFFFLWRSNGTQNEHCKFVAFSGWLDMLTENGLLSVIPIHRYEWLVGFAGERRVSLFIVPVHEHIFIESRQLVFWHLHEKLRIGPLTTNSHLKKVLGAIHYPFHQKRIIPTSSIRKQNMMKMGVG